MPIETVEPETKERLARLERQGIIRRATVPMPRELLSEEPPSAKKGVSALAALLEERATGR